MTIRELLGELDGLGIVLTDDELVDEALYALGLTQEATVSPAEPATTARCDSCQAATINGVYCHETGCPRTPRECRECGRTVAGLRHGGTCDDCRAETDRLLADYADRRDQVG